MEKMSALYIDMKGVDGETWVRAHHMCPSSKADLIKTRLTAGGVIGSKPSYTGGPSNVCAVFDIQAKYLRWGSASEGGWCAYPGVPIKWVGVA